MRKSFRSLVVALLAPVIAAAPLVVSAESPPYDVVAVPSPAPTMPVPSAPVSSAPAVELVPSPGAVPSPTARVVGTDSPEAGMETALLAVRRLVDIDDNIFTDFNHSSTFSNWETREGLVWSFSWSGENAHIFANVSGDGKLLSLNRFDDSPFFGFAELSRSDAVARAYDFMRRANPDVHQFFSATDDVQVSLHSSQFTVVFNAEIEGFGFPAAQITVGVDKFDGGILSYNTRNIDPRGFNFESTQSLISQSEAVAAFAEKIGLSLEYRSSFDPTTERQVVFPVYTVNLPGMSFISAVTGEVVEFVFEHGRSDSDAFLAGGAMPAAPAAEAEAMQDHARARISPAERAAIERVAGFLTADQALNRFMDAAGLSDMDMDIFDDKSVTLTRDFLETGRYSYSINLFRNVSWDSPEPELMGVFGNIDATTGAVRSFNIFYTNTPMLTGEPAMTAEQVRDTVETFLRGIAPAEFARTRLDEGGTFSLERPGMSFGVDNFNFVRVENDILFRGNNISVTYNQALGRVTNFSLNWNDNITFPSVANVLTPEQALLRFAEGGGSEIIFITTGDGNASLVFDFGSAMIDPFTGGVLDFSGDALEDSVLRPDYSDVLGHWSESYVMRLLENGVYNWSGRFEPDRVMNEVEFVAYIMQIESPWMVPLSAQAFLAGHGINFSASADRQVTRQNAARIIVEFMGFGQLAAHSEWFVYPFNDSVADEFRGYITIARMLGIVSGDAVGNFNPTNSVTRAEAAVMLHDLILARMA